MRAPEFWTRNDAIARAASAVLSPVGWIYGASVAFRRDRARSYRSRAKVVCVGNLTAGGTGKTPVAIAVARELLAGGASVAFLTRGYGGHAKDPLVVDTDKHASADVGDEPLLLSAIVPAIVARDRVAGARLAESRGADVIVMDDGHQNFALKKDLSIVVVDAETGFGNGRMLPAGPLREPVAQGLARADAVVLTGSGDPHLAGYAGPVLRAHLAPACASRISRVVAFDGIGRPSKFYDTLRHLGADLVACHSFADHHEYLESEIASLKHEARNAGATLMTTEKDYVRLNPASREGIDVLPVRAVFERADLLSGLLDRLTIRP